MKRMYAAFNGLDTREKTSIGHCHDSKDVVTAATREHERSLNKSIARMAPEMALNGVTWRNISAVTPY